MLITQILGIIIHLFLLTFLFYNLIKHVWVLQVKPLSILMFYIAAFIALVSMIIAFSVILNPTSKRICIEFFAIFVSEWAIQIICAS